MLEAGSTQETRECLSSGAAETEHQRQDVLVLTRRLIPPRSAGKKSMIRTSGIPALVFKSAPN